MSKYKNFLIIIIITQTVLVLMLLGLLIQIRKKVENFQQERAAGQTEKIKNSDVNPAFETWTSYIDDKRKFIIKLPTNTIESGNINYSFENMEPYSAETISSSGNFPAVSIEISNAKTKPFIPTNYEADEDTTLYIGGRFNIRAAKKFGFIYNARSHTATYVVYYLIFQRNNEMYSIKYSPPLVEYRKNPDLQDGTFKQIIDSVSFTGQHVIPESELQTKGTTKFYTDPQLNYTVSIPYGWNVRHGGDNADPLIIVTNEPESEIYKSKGIDSEYKRIYFSRSGIIFSTSGGVCANVGCDDNGVFTTTIDGVEYNSNITLTAGTQNRFIINTGNLYIGAAYPKNALTSDIRNIITSVQLK